ncbi:hypothetical protein QUB61_15975 [Microcoleus sp. C2D2]
MLVKFKFKNCSSNNQLREIYNLNKGENRNERHLTSKSEEVRALVAEHPDANAGRVV